MLERSSGQLTCSRSSVDLLFSLFASWQGKTKSSAAVGKPGNTATRICWLGIPVACGRDRDWVSPMNDDRDAGMGGVVTQEQRRGQCGQQRTGWASSGHQLGSKPECQIQARLHIHHRDCLIGHLALYVYFLKQNFFHFFY